MKICIKCGVSQPIENYYFEVGGKTRRGSCKKCFNENGKKHYESNKEHYLSLMREWRNKHKEELRSYMKKYYLENKEWFNNKGREWRKKNFHLEQKANKRWREENRERKAATNLAWARKNPEKIGASVARHRAAKLKAMPKWANDFFIEEAYDLAARRSKLKTCGYAKWHVDHIVPLQSKLVCGLHVEHNLQVIPDKANISKNNRWWPDMPTGE